MSLPTLTTSSTSKSLPCAPFPILTTVKQVREWKELMLKEGKNSIGFVPTMGALHDGHLSLVKSSLLSNDATIVSIFVNPAQFAPHEDLATYPRTLESDLAILSSLSISPPPSSTPSSSLTSTTLPKTLSALFLPPVEALYPSGITTEVTKQRGTFVEVKGLQEVMEGESRPGFFRGVATVVLKLFNIVQPTRAYLGQKDIQQALLLRRMLTDLHLTSPEPSNLIIHPTFRNDQTGLALSSRNAYLKSEELEYASVLVDALRLSEGIWETSSIEEGIIDVKEVIKVAVESIEKVSIEAKKKGVEIKLMYISLNDPIELTNLLEVNEGKVPLGKGAVLSGAVMLGRTRLIDNFVFGFELNEK